MHYGIRILMRDQLLTSAGARRRLSPSIHVQLQQVAHATLALFVDQVLAVAEVAAGVLPLIHGLPLGDGHFLPVQGDEDVLGWI